MKNRKVVLIGCGAVGTSFLYSALNQNLFDEYVLIDAFENLSKGNAMDFEDASVMMTTPCRNVKQGNYDDCSDADIIVITAGVPQKPGETRIELIGRNAKIIEDIATNVKDSGFEGITVIASNPVDIIGTIYQRITGFDIHKVIPSGTSLDSARFRYILADKLNINAASINAYVVGEHGDSSVSVFSAATVGGLPLSKFRKFSDSQKRSIHKAVMTKAYKIINTKRATFYGIGACLSRICKAILRDENLVMPVSVVKQGTYDMHVGWPAVIGKDGWSNPLKLELNKDERTRYNKSCKAMKKVFDVAMEQLGR
ncbi:MAG: L-lactate dehydrogenase [Mycoplasma sp.]|nr:L-lactate dehydrogenase [Mycoplasma sp.]